jgi:hypothetical protein
MNVGLWISWTRLRLLDCCAFGWLNRIEGRSKLEGSEFYLGALISLRALVWSQNTVSLCRGLVMNYAPRHVQRRIFSPKANALRLGATVLLADKSICSFRTINFEGKSFELSII